MALASTAPFRSARAGDWINYTNGEYINGLGSYDGMLWVGTNGGVVRIDLSTLTSHFYHRSNSGIPRNQTRTLHIAPKGEIWTSSVGITRFDGMAWTTLTQANSGLPATAANCFASAPDGSLWMGAGGVTRFDGTAWTRTRPSDLGLISNAVKSIVVAPDATVWAGVTPT